MKIMLTVLYVLYVAISAFFVILENRRPQSSYAWLLSLVATPVDSDLYL